MYLEELTPIDALESRTIECKARLNKENIIGWLKTIAGFANAEGGTFYIGAEDKTNKLIGFTRKEADNERNYFNNQVNLHLFPRPETQISFLKYKQREKELYIIEVFVPESHIKPIILKHNNIPSIFVRRDGFTNGATYEEIITMSIKSQNTQYDLLLSDENYTRDDFNQLFEYYSRNNNGRVLTDKALRSIDFFDQNNQLKNGALLFQDDYSGDKTGVQCSAFSGFNKGSQRIITVNRFNGNLIETINYMLDFVALRMNHSFVKLDTSRVTIDAYPQRALFEGIVNAVAHRDYFLDGTQIQIDMFKDRLEITSPGGFYQGKKLGKTFDLSNIISKRRNILICDVLVKCKVMEAAGTGFDKIIEEYKTADDNHKPFIIAASDHFTLVLPDLTYEQGITQNEFDKIEYPPIPSGTQHDEKILAYCYRTARKAGDIAAMLNLSDSSYFRKKILNNLVENGYLEKDRIQNTNYYKTNRHIVRKE